MHNKDLPDLIQAAVAGSNTISRRRMLKTVGAIGLAMPVLGGLLTACDDADDDDAPADTSDDSDDTADGDEPVDDDDADDGDVADEPDDDAKQGGKLIYALTSEPENLDPNSAQAWFEASTFELIHDTLLRVGEDATYVPSLIESWEVSDDGLDYTFHCRDDVTFHDGAEFNAEAVQFHFDRVLDPETRSAAAAPLLGGNLDSVSVIDEYTAECHLNSVFPGFIDACCSPYSSVNSPQAAREYGEDLAQNPVGSGPFILEEWIPRQHIRLVRNPDYTWGPEGLLGRSGPAYIDEIEIRPIEEATVLAGALETGEIDMGFMIPMTEYEHIDGQDHLRIERMLRPGTVSSHMLNAANPPTDDVNVRRAIIQAVDMDEVNELVYGGMQVEPTSIWADPMLENRDDFHWRDVHPFDQDAAAELLDEAGWELDEESGYRQKDGERLELEYICFPGEPCHEGEVMQSQLRDVGIHLEVRELGQPANIDATQAGEHHLRPIGWSGRDSALLSNYLFHPDNAGDGWNFTFHDDDELIALCEDIAGELDHERRLELAAEVEERVFELALALPRSEYARDAGVADHVRDVGWNMSNAHPNLTNAYIVED